MIYGIDDATDGKLLSAADILRRGERLDHQFAQPKIALWLVVNVYWIMQKKKNSTRHSRDSKDFNASNDRSRFDGLSSVKAKKPEKPDNRFKGNNFSLCASRVGLSITSHNNISLYGVNINREKEKKTTSRLSRLEIWVFFSPYFVRFGAAIINMWALELNEQLGDFRCQGPKGISNSALFNFHSPSESLRSTTERGEIQKSSRFDNLQLHGNRAVWIICRDAKRDSLERLLKIIWKKKKKEAIQPRPAMIVSAMISNAGVTRC